MPNLNFPPKFYRGLLDKEARLLSGLATGDTRCVLAGNLALLSGLDCTVESAVAVKHALPLKKQYQKLGQFLLGPTKCPQV